MAQGKLSQWNIDEQRYHAVIVGTGAAGMNCSKKLCEYLEQTGNRNEMIERTVGGVCWTRKTLMRAMKIKADRIGGDRTGRHRNVRI
ncbi:MAG: hypothetical protein QNK29_05550 [Desulfobacterales bacterium]|nr:hypothetical protein [Desulfobacterales bacterium]